MRTGNIRNVTSRAPQVSLGCIKYPSIGNRSRGQIRLFIGSLLWLLSMILMNLEIEHHQSNRSNGTFMKRASGWKLGTLTMLQVRFHKSSACTSKTLQSLTKHDYMAGLILRTKIPRECLIESSISHSAIQPRNHTQRKAKQSIIRIQEPRK